MTENVKENTPIIRVKELEKYFLAKRGYIHMSQYVKAVDGISLDVMEGETVGLVGESGCGKSTLGRTIMKIYEPTGGEIFYRGQNITKLSNKKMHNLRKSMQMIFQDPYASLNPRFTIGDIIEEPMVIHNMYTKAERKEKVYELLELVGLKPDHIRRYPHEFSGGQRQRVGIARTLALNPDFIVCDEPISALDVSIQAQIINLLEKIQDEQGISYLFIAHDLGMVKHISHKIGVMYLGHLVEFGDADEVYNHPLHPYTEALMSAAPIPDPKLARESKRNEVDFATNLPAYVMSEYQGKSDLVLQPNITTRFILFNVTKAPFNNDKVRRAISMALSRAEICKTVGDDYEASTQFIAKYMLSNLGTGKKFSDESGEMVTEDIAKAKSLLAEAGYPDGAGFPTVTYNYPNNEQDKLIAQAIQAQLKSALNINVELNGMESQVCVSERKSGNFDMTRHNWTADYDDAMDYLLMWTSTSGLNDAGIKDADYDKLCEDATAELDETKRNTIIHDAEKLLVTDKAYVAPLATNKTICLLNPKYTGYSFDSAGQILLKFIKAAE